MIIETSDRVASPFSYLPRPKNGRASKQHNTGLARSRSINDDEAIGDVIAYVSNSGFSFEPWQIATYITAVRTKPFVILAGISGTGKSKLPKLVAEATASEMRVVPVRPDWTDSSDLLGFERLDGTFVPGHLLRLCDRALSSPEMQFFFVLDEMNIARVEYYFAEVLSVLESRRRVEGRIISDPLISSATGQSLESGRKWSDVYLPENVAIIGTVNMDETTHGFSRKVLDRSFVLELSDVDLGQFPQLKPSNQFAPAPWTAADWAPRFLSLAEVEAPEEIPAIVNAVSVLVRANASLALGQMQVGYRVRDEVALFCLQAEEVSHRFVDGSEAFVDPIDICFSMKVLPRLQGSSALMGEILEELESWTSPGTSNDVVLELERSRAKIQLMRSRLLATGFTSYWL